MQIYKFKSSHGVTSRREILETGSTRRQLAAAVAGGQLLRLDRCRYALPGAAPAVIAAATAGAKLTCVSALTLYGIDAWNDSYLHLRLPRYSRRRRTLPDDAIVCERFNDGLPDLVVPVDEALRCLAHHHTEEQLIVALDSALRNHVMTRRQLHDALSDEGHRLRRLLVQADARAESPLESVLRLRLLRARIQAVPQVEIPFVGRVDFLVGTSLILEADGRAWHSDSDTFEKDRRRDAQALALGYQTIRITSQQLRHEWPLVLGTIQSVITRGDHLRLSA